MVVTYNFTLNATIPDGNGQFTDMRTLGGFASYSNIAVNLQMSSPNGGNPMWLGDLYSTLTVGTPKELNRTAVLLNRPGRDNSDAFGSSASSLNVTLDDSASHSNVWGSNGVSGTYNSDGRIGVNPYASGVAFDNGDRNATLTGLNGSALASNRFTLLMADTESSAIARLDSYGLTVTGAAAGSGTMDAGGGTFSISDTGSGATNNVGASVVTTQVGGGPLAVNIAGTMNFNAAVSGTSGLTKSGTGTLTLANATGNTYSGGTTVNAGTLLANNTSNSATGTGAVTVNNSGTLGGTGIISGAVMVNAGGSITGATDGTVGTLTLNSTATFSGLSGSLAAFIVDISGITADQLAIAGMLSLSGIFDQILFNGAADGTTTYVLATYGSLGGTFDTVTNLPSGYQLVYGATELDLVPVPEPSTWVAGGLALSALLYSRIRRRKLLNGLKKFAGWFPIRFPVTHTPSI